MTLPEQVSSLRRTIHRLLTRRLSGHTRRPFQHLVALKQIGMRGACTQAKLAENLLIDAPAASRMVDRLEEEGLVKRCAGEDRRSVRLEVTDAGLGEVELLEEQVRALDREAGRYLTATEVRELKRLLEKLHAGLLQEQASSERSGVE